MTDEVKNTPAEEVKNIEPATTEAVSEVPKGEAKEETVGDLLAPAKKEKEESVPLATFLELKSSNKELMKELKGLKKSIEEGATKKEVSADLQELADKHNVDPDFLRDFAKAVRQQAEEEVTGKIEERLKPITERDRAEKLDKVFNEHFARAMESLPELKDVVNKETIKNLSLVPQNSNKTFTQIIEEAYGHVVQGKRTIDTASTRAGKTDSVDVDVDRAKKDPEYFSEVMGNPMLKKKYNESMMKTLTSRL